MKQVRNSLMPVLAKFPAFVVYALVGCAVGYYIFGIPHGELGVAVSVPFIMAFVISRVADILIPDPAPADLKRKPSRQAFAVGLVLFILAFGCLVMAFSGGAYALIGLGALASGALKVSLLLGLLCFSITIVTALSMIARRIPLFELVNLFILRMILEIARPIKNLEFRSSYHLDSI